MANGEENREMARQAASGEQLDWRPRPDPTSATEKLVDTRSRALRELIEARLDGMDTAVRLVADTVRALPAESDAARRQLRDELLRLIQDIDDKSEHRNSTLREFIESRLDAMDKATELLAATVGRVPSETDMKVGALRELLGARIDGMDTATKLLADNVRQVPTGIDKAMASVRDILVSEIRSVQDVSVEKFGAIAGTFESNALALTAALAAQKEAAAEAKKSSDLAIDKSEKATQETIRANAGQTSTSLKALEDRLNEYKEQLVNLGSRLDKGEGTSKGMGDARLDSQSQAQLDQTALIARGNQVRAAVSIGVAVFSVLISLILAVVIIIRGG